MRSQNAAHKKLAGLEQAENLKQSLRRILTDFIRQQEVRMYMRSMEAFIAITVKNAEILRCSICKRTAKEFHVVSVEE